MTILEKQKPLYIRVYEQFKEELSEGSFQSGERIVESNLAKKYGVSRGTIREAIRLLEQDGLLEDKEKSLHVVKFTESDVIEMYQCRKSLECLAAELACENITDEEIHILNNAVEQATVSKDNNEHEKVIYFNTVFHEGIVKASRNKLLMGLLESLNTRIFLMRRMRNTLMTKYSGYEFFIDEHRGILNAIENRNPELAKERVSAHIDSDIEAFMLFAKKSGLS